LETHRYHARGWADRYHPSSLCDHELCLSALPHARQFPRHADELFCGGHRRRRHDDPLDRRRYRSRRRLGGLLCDGALRLAVPCRIGPVDGLASRHSRQRFHWGDHGLLRDGGRAQSLHHLTCGHGDRTRALPDHNQGHAALALHAAGKFQGRGAGHVLWCPLRDPDLRRCRHPVRFPAAPGDCLPQGLLHRQQREGGTLFRHPHQPSEVLGDGSLLDAVRCRRCHLYVPLRCRDAHFRRRHGAEYHRGGGYRRGFTERWLGHDLRRHPWHCAALGRHLVADPARCLCLLAGHDQGVHSARRRFHRSFPAQAEGRLICRSPN